METANWKNQYIGLSYTLPSLLYSAKDKAALTNDEIQIIQSNVLNHKRIYLEFGSGSGEHILKQAQNDPDAFFTAFELRYKRAYRTAEKAFQSGISNLYVIRADANEVGTIFRPGMIDGIFINFPDPWARMRWKKHRMINGESLTVWARLLKDGGFIRYKTDHVGYYDDTLKLLQSFNSFEITNSTRNYYESPVVTKTIQSEFEKLFIYKQLPIYYLELQKKIAI